MAVVLKAGPRRLLHLEAVIQRGGFLHHRRRVFQQVFLHQHGGLAAAAPEQQ